MKRPKKFNRQQKICITAHSLSLKEWRLIEEMDFHLKIFNTRTKKTRYIDKFRGLLCA